MMIFTIARAATRRRDGSFMLVKGTFPSKSCTPSQPSSLPLPLKSSLTKFHRFPNGSRSFSEGKGRNVESIGARSRSSTVSKRKKSSISGNGFGASLKTKRTGTESINQFLNKPRTLPIPRWISPQHVTITYSECFGHSSFLLVAISYYMDDFLTLRTIAIAGSSAMLVFTYFHPHGRILWLPFKWNLMFIAINGYRVMKVHVDRFFAEQLSPLMLQCHDTHFYVMDKVDFARLARLGVIETFRRGDVVVEQDQDNRYIRLVLEGELSVQRDGQLTYELHDGNFISESGLHAGLLLHGNVRSCCSVVAKDDNVKCLRWDRTELTHLLEVDKDIRRTIKAVMSWDIVAKLKSQRALIASGKINDTEKWTRKRREQTTDRYKHILSNMLMHPRYLNKRKEELHMYRDIHQIPDENHRQSLEELGWSLEEFEAGKKDGQVDEDLIEEGYGGWQWYAHDLKFRLFG